MMAVLDIPTLADCGCKARVYSDGSGVDIEYCNMHFAAPKLANAVENLLADIKEAWNIELLEKDSVGYRLGKEALSLAKNSF